MLTRQSGLAVSISGMAEWQFGGGDSACLASSGGPRSRPRTDVDFRVLTAMFQPAEEFCPSPFRWAPSLSSLGMQTSEFGLCHRAVEVRPGGIFVQGSIGWGAVVCGAVITVHMADGDHGCSVRGLAELSPTRALN